MFAGVHMNEQRTIRIAILDLYEGVENQGMRCIRAILTQYRDENQLDLVWDEFEVRQEKNLPDLTYDLYISSGGPGSPLASENSEWENKFFQWIAQVEKYNNNPANRIKKHVFFICHSFQLATRYFKVANVCRKKVYSFRCVSRSYVTGWKKRTCILRAI